MKRILLTALILIASFSFMAPVNAKAATYVDVHADTPYAAEITYVSEHGLFSGTGNGHFSPDTTLTRAMFVTVLGKTAMVNADWYAAPTAFTDVREDSYYAPFVNWANGKGFVVGYGDGRFGSDDPVTRAQMHLIANRFAAYYDINVSFDPIAETGAPASRAEAAGVIAKLHRAFTAATKTVSVNGTIAPVRIAPVNAIPGILLDGGVMPDD